MTVVLDDLGDFSLEALRRVAWAGEDVRLGELALARMRQARERFLTMIGTVPGLHVYGVTTGFGDNAGRMLTPAEQERQARMPAIIRGTGVGPTMPARAVRAMIFSRLVNYVSGHAAVSLETAQAVADMLDGRPLPDVRLGGMDSGGELLQLFTLYHHLMGEMSQPRDQNALRNGTGCAPGLAGDMALRARRRGRVAAAVFALSVDAAALNMDPWDPALVPLIRDPHEAEAIGLLGQYLAGVDMAGRRAYQPPISWRVLTRMLGHMLRVTAMVEAVAEGALTSVNDNPVYLDEDASPPHGRVISTGGFHAPGIYHAMNWMSAAWADLAAIAAKQTDKLHRAEVTGLPDRLWKGDSRYSTWFLSGPAFEMARRAQAAAAPALIPLHGGNDGQTDTIMPLFEAWEKEGVASRCLDLGLAMLAASASQALHVAGRAPAPPLRALLKAVREAFPVVESARDLGADAERLADMFGDWALTEGPPIA